MTRYVARTIAVALCLCFAGFAGFAGAADDERTAIERDHGLALVDGDGREAWTDDEIHQIRTFLQALPPDLANAARVARLKQVRVFKRLGPADEETHRTPLAAMRWQMFLEIGQDYVPGSRILPRRMVHHLLHLYDGAKRVSSGKDWRSLSGWQRRKYFGVELPLDKEAANQDPRGYGSPAGLASSAADFATFGEAFFVPESGPLEDSIVCRTPDKFRFFMERFGVGATPLASYADACRGVGEGLLDDLVFLDPVTRQPIAFGPVDATTVEGFELLYATPGVQDAAEIAGHLVLRIKLRNNLWAERAGIENPQDLVVSFLADTDAGLPARAPRPPSLVKSSCDDTFLGMPERGHETDAVRSVLQALKGLSGGFLTTFDRQTLQQTVRTYTVDQDRNLLRYRLNLTDAQQGRLLERLYAAKKNFKSKYYFFDRNCASILVQVIGEGIGDDEIASFDPMVVPPNALVALLLRKGLASPVQPAFYGYRKRAYVAQEIIRDEAQGLADPRALFHKNAKRRVAAWDGLAEHAAKSPELRGAVYRLATLGQEAEMAFMDKSALCEAYASPVVERIRALQQTILEADPNVAETHAVDVNSLVAARFAPVEQQAGLTGSTHTSLSSIAMGGGMLAKDATTHEVMTLSTTLHRQALGSISAQSMQRATGVALGDVHVALDGDGIQDWQATGLELRKLKERLDRVPSFASAEGSVGLGLTVLSLTGDPTRGVTKGTVLGGELLFNLASSRLYDDYLLLGVGAGVDSAWRRGEHDGRTGDAGPAFPLRLDGLLTFGPDRAWQLRGGAEVRYTFKARALERTHEAHIGAVHRLAEPRGTELLMRMDAVTKFDPELGGNRRGLTLGLEWNRW